MTVTGPNGVVRVANGQPPGTGGILCKIQSVSNDIIYNVYENYTAPGNWIEILFNISKEGSTSISFGFSEYTVSPSGTTITMLPKGDFTKQGVFTAGPGGGWVFAITPVVPISPNSIHKISSFSCASARAP